MANELDTAFLKIILERGLVTEFQVDQARKTFRTMEKQGVSASVPQVFIQLRFLKPAQVKTILQELQTSPNTPPVPAPAGQPAAPLQLEGLTLGTPPPTPVPSTTPTPSPSPVAQPVPPLPIPTDFAPAPTFSNTGAILLKIGKAALSLVVFAVLSYGILILVRGINKAEQRPLASQTDDQSSPPAEDESAESPTETQSSDGPAVSQQTQQKPAQTSMTFFEFENRFLTFLDHFDYAGALKYLEAAPDSVKKSSTPEQLEALREKVTEKAIRRFREKQSMIEKLVKDEDFSRALEIVQPLQDMGVPEVESLVGELFAKLKAGQHRGTLLQQAVGFQETYKRIEPDLQAQNYSKVIEIITSDLDQPRMAAVSEFLKGNMVALQHGEKFMSFLVEQIKEKEGKYIKAFGRSVRVVSVNRESITVKVGVKQGSRQLGKLEPENVVDLLGDKELTDDQKFGVAIYAYAGGDSKLSQEWLSKLPQDYEVAQNFLDFKNLLRNTEASIYLRQMKMDVEQFKHQSVGKNGQKLLEDYGDSELVKAYEDWIKKHIN